MLKKLFWFLGFYLLPIGLLLLPLSSLLINSVSSIIHTQLYIPIAIKLLIVFTPSILATLFNTYLFVFKDTRNFNIFTINAGRPKSISNEKWKAMNPDIPSRYLTDKPNIGTIGFSNKTNKYITIPIIEDLKQGNANIVGIFGGSGAKKTTTLLTSIVLASEQRSNLNIPSMILWDIKPDIHQRMPNVYKNVNVVSFTDKDNELYYGWDMYAGINEHSSDDEIIRHMRMLSSCLIYNKDSVEHASYFYDNARNILTAYLYGTYKHLGLGFIDAITKLTSIDLQQNIEQLTNIKDTKLKSMLGIYLGKEGESFDDISTTLTTSLYVFTLDGVKYALRDNPKKAKPEDLLNGRSIITKIPDAQLNLLGPLMAAQAEMTLNYILSLEDRVGKNEKGIWIILDELQNLPMIPSLIRAASLVRSKSCSLWYISQSVDALSQKYTDKGVNSLFENTSQLIILSAMSELTLKLVTNNCGNYRCSMHSSSISGRSAIGNISSSTSEQYRPIMEYEDTRALRQLNAFIALTSEGWFRAQKFTIRDSKELLQRSDNYVEENEKILRKGVNKNFIRRY